jgi:methionyl aminopeptidase
MIITRRHDLELYRQAGALSTRILFKLKSAVKAGVYPIEVDQLAESLCEKNSVKPAFKGVGYSNPYQYSTCISVNDVVVHGIPSRTEAIKLGDIVKVDFGLIYQGLYTDHCFSVIVGKGDKTKIKLVTAARDSVQAAVKLAVSGNRLGDLGAEMHAGVTKFGFDVLKQYTGHGIGRGLHESPAVPAYGKAGTGEILETGMVLCVESQVVTGSDRVKVAPDGWSVVTADHGDSAMFEYMVVVQRDKPYVLTDTFDWGMIV